MVETRDSFGHNWISIISSLGYERVYLPLCKVADTPFHIQGDEFWSVDELLSLES